MPSVSTETPSTRWLSLCKFKGLIPRVTLRSPWALLCRAVGTGFRFISAFTDRLVLYAPSNFFKSVFQFSSILCSVLAQTVEEPFFCTCRKYYWMKTGNITEWKPEILLNETWKFYCLIVICGLSNAAYQRPDGVYVLPINMLKNWLFSTRNELIFLPPVSSVQKDGDFLWTWNWTTTTHCSEQCLLTV